MCSIFPQPPAPSPTSVPERCAKSKSTNGILTDRAVLPLDSIHEITSLLDQTKIILSVDFSLGKWVPFNVSRSLMVVLLCHLLTDL